MVTSLFKLNKMNKYYNFSDEYKSLHNIFYNGEYYTIKEVLDPKFGFSNELIIKLIKENL